MQVPQGKLFEENLMPIIGAPEKSTSSNGVVLKGVSHGHNTNMDIHDGSVSELHISGAHCSQSPFRTPPSLSYRHDKVTNFSCFLNLPWMLFLSFYLQWFIYLVQPTKSVVNKESLRECTGLRQHKKVSYVHVT